MISTQEKKFFDTVQSTVTLTSGGQNIIPSLNLVSLGNGESQMQGRKITIKRINWRAAITKDIEQDPVAANVQAADTIRVLMIQDNQCNGTAAIATDVLANDNYTGYMNLANSTRFKIIKEWNIDMPSGPALWNGTNVISLQATKHIKYSKKCNIDIEFLPQAGGSRVIGEVRSNNIFVMAWARLGSTDIVSRTRIRYTDN